MKTILALLISAAGALAQNSDLGVLGGISGPQGQTNVNGSLRTTTGSVAPSIQLNYAWQVLTRNADLYVETPFVIVARESGTVVSSPAGSAAAGSSGPDLFFTPGVRVKISPEARVSFYAAFGVGVASFTPTSVIVSPATVVSGSRRNSFAVGFGGGLDLRLTRLLSLRGDLRDFVTSAGLGEVTGRNHAILQIGIAFHF